MWRNIRVALLLYVLLMVAVGSWLARERSTDWDEKLWVTVFPINGDGSAQTEAYIRGLQRADLEPIAEFFAGEAARYRLGLTAPVRIGLGAVVAEQPPDPPASRNPLLVAWWSLKLRWWAWTVDKGAGPPSDVEIFAKYYDPETHTRLPHSLGLEKGLLGVTHLFASPEYAGSNEVVVAHEFLHTVGARDKYDPSTSYPLYPEGFADPGADPLLPQRRAELMGGRIPISEAEAVTPRSLAEVVLGEQTAREINWLR